MKRVLSFIADEEETGRALRSVIRYKTGMSSGLLTSLKHREGTISVNGKPVHTDYIVHGGDQVTLIIEDEDSSENIIPVKGFLNIAYEDEDILILNKPPFMPCHPSKDHIADSLANLVAGYYENEDHFVFRCVTRLDRDTSGLVVTAKNRLTHDLLSEQRKNGGMKKFYYAVAEGVFENNYGRIDKNIRRVPDIASIRREVCDRNDGVTAVTDYEVLKSNQEYSLLKISTVTGRTHQIRVHMAAIGHPLAGDWLYGREGNGFPRQMLHCGEVSLTNPLTAQKIELKTELPQDFPPPSFFK